MTSRAPKSLPVYLYFKHLLIFTPLERVAKQLRWWSGVGQRWRHPELWEIYLEDERMDKALQRLLKDDSLTVDVGAHIGSFLSRLKKYSPAGKQIAFEPSKIKSQWLRRKFPDVEVHSIAVGNRSGKATFEEHTKDAGYSRLLVDRGSDLDCFLYTVKICKLDDALSELDKLDLLKLDIEGGELDAIRGGTQIIQKHRPHIVFECGNSADHKSEIYNLLIGDLQYDVFTFSDFLYDLKPMTLREFLRCGMYPFRAVNFLAMSRPHDNNRACPNSTE